MPRVAVMSLGRKYDAINTAIFLTAGGSRRVRRALVGALDVRPRQRLLELGCGTGQVTALLVAAGAEVVAVDALPEMLDAARHRAPGATFVHGDASEVDVGTGFESVVLSFVLHNFDADGRRRLLCRAAGSLTENGSIGVLDWSEPHGRARAALWRRFLGWLEPSSAVTEILDGELDADAAAAGLHVRDRRSTAGGRAQILVLRRA